MTFSRADFPADFLFGVATSAYQIEGHGAGGAGRTHWDDFAAAPGNVAHGEDGRRACDHYHRWEEDLDLVRDAGFDSYRFSASWARVMPEGRGTVNAEGLDFYDRLVDGMLARGLKPALTLYHWELPSALQDLGGWRNRDIAGWFADYAEVLLGRIGDRVWSTAPVNEPWCVAWLSHFLGHHAPGLRDIRAAARAMHHVLLAHGAAVETARGLGVGNLGAVCNFEHAIPADGSEASAAATRRHDALINRWFVSALFNRQYPEEALDGIAPHLPRGWEKDLDRIAQPLDWFGINYYTRKLVAAAPGPWPGLSEVEGHLPRTRMGWEIHPEGLSDILLRIHEGYTRGLPLIVTENGMAAADRVQAGQVQDPDRIAYLEGHLAAVRTALAQGVPVRGYHVWSLLDNFEWAFGYDQRFGLVHVDFQNLQRTPKASYHALARALAR
ncbi:GH1 family beta-glucosidase [Cereibacter sphaeroides]|uniref:GH1 family beta-glucosidase n=1 Tax=Cereibacter sphaeroides TaxID=1063 RepID=UPI000191C2A8|nr:GH1 family beta-glucosidase [Cereibacter sphaeroides]ACM01050.1 Beta-glucosidase [Cereibacter sphaeroides KD131]